MRPADSSAALPLPLLVGLNALSSVSVNIFLPSMPAIVRDLHTDIAAVVGALSLFLAAFGVGQLCWGSLSDRYGRRATLVASAILFVIGSAVCASASSIAGFLCGRVVQALGAAGGAAISRAMIRDTRGREDSASTIGYMVMATSVGSGMAPVAGGLLDAAAGWRAVFALLLVLGIALVFACLRFLPETHPPQVRGATRLGWDAYIALARSPRFLRYCLFGSFLMGCWYGFVSGAPLVIVGVWNVSPIEFSLWWTFTATCFIAGNFLAGKFSTRYGTHLIVRSGTITILAGAAALGALAAMDVHAAWTIFLPMGLLLIGFGAAMPCATASAMDADARRIGAASALLGSSQIAVALASITLVGNIGGMGGMGAGWLALICGVMAVLAASAFRFIPDKP